MAPTSLVRIVVATLSAAVLAGCHATAPSRPTGRRIAEDARPAAPRRDTAPSQQQDRRAFAAAMDRIKPGMPAGEATARLGPPDDVRTQADPGGISTARTSAIWCWGVEAHLGFPVLGRVYVDEAGRVQYVFGGQGQPPDPKLLPEAELRPLLRLMDQAPAYSGSGYDPALVIRIVNALQPLGKAKALAAIREYLRVASAFHSPAREGLFLVLRVLFEAPGVHPPMYVGGPSPAAPADARALPRFPVLLVGDVPLLTIWGYFLAGQAEPVERHVEWYAQHGTLRARPLAPSPAPLDLLDPLVGTAQWLHGAAGSATSERGRTLLANQLLRLVATVHASPTLGFGELIAYGPTFAAEWSQVKTLVARRAIRWDARQGAYTFTDGTMLPRTVRPLWRRHVWEPGVAAGKLRLILERTTVDRMRVELRWHTERGEAAPVASVRLLGIGPDGARSELTRFELGVAPAGGPGRTTIQTQAGRERYVVQVGQVSLSKGTRLQADLLAAGRTVTSPMFDPEVVEAPAR